MVRLFGVNLRIHMYIYQMWIFAIQPKYYVLPFQLDYSFTQQILILLSKHWFRMKNPQQIKFTLPDVLDNLTIIVHIWYPWW